ncbi:glycosyltransferase [Candidatus Saccharibacteria bacterium]|nr:glycosyltransferase [Candidatus Saccharibacteria bacterium]
MKVSMIVPVYNAEKYIERCVESMICAIKQYYNSEGVISSHENCEILLVDNGSSDRSWEILEQIRTKCPKIVQIMRYTEPGAAVVRNYGIRKARGKYVWFIDADDEIARDAILKLVNCAEKNAADLVMMGASRIYADGHTDYLSAVKPSEPNFKSRFVRYGAGPWQFLIRREWWVQNKIKFREGMIHEDMELISSLILYSPRFAATDEPLYLYYQNDESVLHKKVFDAHVFDIFPALDGLYRKFRDHNATEQYHDELEWFFIWNLLIDAAKDFGKWPEARAGFARSRKMLRKYFPTWKKNRFLRQKPLKLRLRVVLNYCK